MTETELRDHAAEVLTAVVQDMGIAQSPGEQSRKSQGDGAARTMEATGRLHADDRIEHGFTFRAVPAEFRALRATVLRLYEKSGQSDAAGVRRFNEAIDETMTESMDRFAVQTDLFRDQFIGVLSHDLRTPLGAITAGAALLAAPDDNPERRARVLTRMMSSAQRMERMISDLLDLTRTKLGGSLALQRKPANLQQIFEEAVMEIRGGHAEAAVEWHASGDLRGEWDTDRLTQVVSNLIANAIQHGRGAPVTLTARGRDDAVTLAVHNGSPPIASELLPRVFEPLARGAGTVPPVVSAWACSSRVIVSAHDGRIEVSSSPDEGTTFTVTLPRGL